MAHLTNLSAAIGDGDDIVTVDMSLATYPSTGKLPASCIYVSANATTTPTPVTATNGLYVQPGTATTWAVTIGAALPTGGNTIGDVTISGAALTALQLIDDAVKTDDAAFTPASDKVLMIGAQFDDASPDTVNEGDAGAPRMSSRRELYMQIRDAAGNERGVNIDASNRMQVLDGNSAAMAASLNTMDDWDLSQTCKVSPIPTQVGVAGGSGAVGSTTQRVTIGTDDVVSISAQLLDNVIVQDDAGFVVGTHSVSMSGYLCDETATDTVNEGDAGAARMTADRKQIVTEYAHTDGGCDPIKILDSDETEDEVKATAGQLYDLYLFNSTNAILYVKLYNATAANVTVGTTTPVMTIPVPGNNDIDGAGVVRNWSKGLRFDTAITIATTTGLADNDTGAPGANAMTISGSYK